MPINNTDSIKTQVSQKVNHYAVLKDRLSSATKTISELSAKEPLTLEEAINLQKARYTVRDTRSDLSRTAEELRGILPMNVAINVEKFTVCLMEDRVGTCRLEFV